MNLRGNTFSRRMQLLFVGFCLFYFVIPPVATVAFPRLRGEIYPLSMWSMFYRVHNRVEDFGLRIISVDGKPLPGKPYFEGAGFRRSQSIAAYHAIQKLGREIQSRNAKGIVRTRRTVEEAYLGKRVEYQVVERVWDPLVRFRTRAFEKEDLIADMVSQTEAKARP